ncbi:MAG: CDP-alcohol phosphatidyltransferase family protein, partial [Alphaproteobacteria bacterium]
MPTLYLLKPRFQALLRPSVARIAGAGVSANQVTLLAAIVSVMVGAGILLSDSRQAFLILPIWFLVRMALNAVDGMLAREFG